MTLVQLRHFLALAETASFSKAAQQNFLTQPALSRSIQALERELGWPLFDRIGRRIELSSFGRQIVERAGKLVFEAEELRLSGQRLRDGEAGPLRVGMGSGPGAMLMTPLLMKMAERHPHLHVEVSRGGTAMLLQALRARSLDAVVVDTRSLQPAPDLHAEVLCEMHGAFMVRKGHPLLRLRHTLRFADVRRYPMASTPLSDEIVRILVERYGIDAHPSLAVTLRCDEISSLIDVTQTTDAVLLAIRAAAPHLHELTLQPPLAASARFGLITLAARSAVPSLGLVRDLMRERLVG